MSRRTIVACLLMTVFCGLFHMVPAQAQKTYLEEINGVERLIWRGEPFLMLSGEFHNSTSTTAEYLEPAMVAAKKQHLNSVIVTVEWDQLEPEPGKYDFTCVDRIISLAEKNDLPVVIAWFGSWKNGVSSYIPGWMKRDTKKYFRAVDRKGEATDYISTFCTAAMEADSRAFSALMRHIGERDRNNYVLFVQVENETGLWQEDMDYCPQARRAYESAVPEELISFLRSNETILPSPMMDCWVENGRKMKGDWEEVFGDNMYTPAFFMQWAYASYVQKVASAGKKQYDIPMYMNTVAMPPKGLMFNPGVVQGPSKHDDEAPSEVPAAPLFGTGNPLFPSGAPVFQAIDMYHVFCPSVDFFSPDIYVPAFKDVADAYTRKDNPLFVPETGRSASAAYYTLAQCNGIGFSAFAIEDAYLDRDYIGTYETLEELLPIISEYQGTGLMKGFLREGTETGTSFEIDDYIIDVRYVTEEKRSFGLVIKTGPEDFLLSGIGAMISIRSKNEKVNVRYEFVQEGRYEDEEWAMEVLLNGDQTSHGQEVYLRGRVDFGDEFSPEPEEVYPHHNFASSEARQDIVTARQKSPSIYKTRVYSYNKN